MLQATKTADFVSCSPGSGVGGDDNDRLIINPWDLLQHLDEEQDEDYYNNKLRKRSPLNKPQENDNLNHGLQKRSPIDPNAIYQVPLFGFKAWLGLKKGLLKGKKMVLTPLVPIPGVGPLGDKLRLKIGKKALKKFVKSGFFGKLVPLSLIPI